MESTTGNGSLLGTGQLGDQTATVYDFCAKRWQRWISACKGMAGDGKPIVPARPSTLRNGARLWMVGVDRCKELIYTGLRLEEFGPNYCHFPNRPEYDEEYFKQLTAEQLQTKKRNGFRCAFLGKDACPQ